MTDCYHTLAEGPLPEDQSAVVVLQGTGDDLGGRRRVTVHEHDHWLVRYARSQASPVGLLAELTELLPPGRAAAGGGEDRPPLQEHVRHEERLVEVAARVPAQVDDDSAGILEGLERVRDLLCRLACHSIQRHVADVSRQYGGLDGGHVHRIPLYGERQGLPHTRPPHGQSHRCSGGAPDAVRRRGRGPGRGVVLVHPNDHIADLKASLCSRGAAEHGRYRDHVVELADGDADAGVVAGRLLFELLDLRRSEDGRIRIAQLLDQAVEGVGPQRRVAVGLHVESPDLLQRAQEHLGFDPAVQATAAWFPVLTLGLRGGG